MSEERISSTVNSSGILMKTKTFSSNTNMSSTAHDTPAENIHINPLKHNSTKYLSSLGDKSGKADVMKAKRSADAEVSAECEPFTIGDEATKTFFSPGYPKEYTKNITCVRVIEGK